RVLRSLRECVYREPALFHEVMKDYPFIPVAGFDAAVSSLDEDAPPYFYEYNSETPSGISNNTQLQEIHRQIDPAVYAVMLDRMPKDDTWAKFRGAIESCALKWTGNNKGITVMIGPGSANGAHPDVASIASFTGWPLVNVSDLYEDRAGNI